MDRKLSCDVPAQKEEQGLGVDGGGEIAPQAQDPPTPSKSPEESCTGLRRPGVGDTLLEKPNS